MAAAEPSFNTSKDSTSWKLIFFRSAPMTPSIIINGAWPEVSVLVPRKSIWYPASGSAPFGLVIDNPATLPWTKPMGSLYVPLLNSSDLIEVTAPVSSFLVVMPYPMMTTSPRSSLASDIMTSITALPSTATLTVLNPVNRKDIVASGGTSSLYLPSISVIVPIVMSLTETLTPGKGAPETSVTNPETAMFTCACAYEATEMPRIIAIIKGHEVNRRNNFIFIPYSGCIW